MSTERLPHHILIGVRSVIWLFDRPFGAALDIQEGGNMYKDRDFTKDLKNKWKWFFLLPSIPSMFMTLCHTLVSYLISFVYMYIYALILFYSERKPNYCLDPLSSLLVEKLLENKCFSTILMSKIPRPSTIRYINR